MMKEQRASADSLIKGSVSTSGHVQNPQRHAPNVVMVVIDDLGFAQLGCYGADIATPNIDGLAEHGLRYNNFHVTAICGPSRACLLTGRNHHAVGLGFFPIPMGLPGYAGRIPPSAGTLPRNVRQAGFNTFAVGKWDLTPGTEATAAGPFTRWPLGFGFERFYGFLGTDTNQWAPDLTRDNGFIEPPSTPSEGYHLTEDLADQAIRFIQDQQQASPDKPFFLYLATGAMHSPHHVPEEWVEPYQGQFDEGWDVCRKRTFHRQVDLGIVPAEATLTTSPSWVPAWDDLSPDERRLFARQMEIYAGFLTHTDAQIGRVLEFLWHIDALDNTLVMLVSDNGASGDGGPNGTLHATGLAHIDDAGTILDRIDELGQHRAYNEYAWGWAWAGSTPFRLWKSYTWLGGVRVPLIVHWPAGIDPQWDGQVRSQFCHAIDLMPTILDAAGIEAAHTLDGVDQQPFDGQSIVPTFNNPTGPAPRNTQYFEMMGSRSIYHDGWKATTNHVIAAYPADRKLVEGSLDFDTDQWSLFNLHDDFSEAHDLADTHPERLRHLVELWWHEAGRNNVLPLMDDIDNRLAAAEPTHTPQQRVLRPHGGPVTTRGLGEAFRIIADIEIPHNHETSGIICAQGDWNTGWACLVHNCALTVTFNTGSLPKGITHKALPTGRHCVEVTYRPTEQDATATLTIDGKVIGTTRITGKPLLHPNSRKLFVGRDQGLPVSDSYTPPFHFTGNLHTVTHETLELSQE